MLKYHGQGTGVYLGKFIGYIVGMKRIAKLIRFIKRWSYKKELELNKRNTPHSVWLKGYRKWKGDNCQ